MYSTSTQVVNTLLRPLCGRLATLKYYGHAPLRRITTSQDFESKYAEKLRQRANKAGFINVEDLKNWTKQQAEEARHEREAMAAKLAAQASNASPANPASQTTHKLATTQVRKDSSPIKPLSTILNLPKVMATPHTAEQIGALWTAYHTSRSGGTGRGYVCASVPLELYKKMADVAERYPTFVVPVPRIKPPTEAKIEGEEDTAYEFYFLQWNFHDIPLVPSKTEDPFIPHKSTFSGTNLRTSTILFTPLQEYKMRATFATPYLVLTHYTDLIHTHGIVLLRGEITPASAGNGAGVDGRYMLSQEDAQLLSMATQKFYLWGGENQEQEGKRLLKCFHDTPQDFKWEDLLKHANWKI